MNHVIDCEGSTFDVHGDRVRGRECTCGARQAVRDLSTRILETLGMLGDVPGFVESCSDSELEDAVLTMVRARSGAANH